MSIPARADIVCPVCLETNCQTWTCARCECVLVADHLIPYGWSELHFDGHNARGLRRFYFCSICSSIVGAHVAFLTGKA